MLCGLERDTVFIDSDAELLIALLFGAIGGDCVINFMPRAEHCAFVLNRNLLLFGFRQRERSCETSVFDGQRLAMKADEQPAAAATKPATAKPVARRRGVSKRVENDEPAKKPDSPSTLSSLFRR